jgi:hypothetical protein
MNTPDHTSSAAASPQPLLLLPPLKPIGSGRIKTVIWDKEANKHKIHYVTLTSTYVWRVYGIVTRRKLLIHRALKLRHLLCEL